MTTAKTGPSRIDFGLDAPDELDVSNVAPTPVKARPELRAEAEKLGASLGFTSRAKPDVPQQAATHVAEIARSEPPEVLRRGRKKVIGRTVQFTVKLKPETNNAIYTLADEMGDVPLAEVIEKAIDALARELSAKKR